MYVNEGTLYRAPSGGMHVWHTIPDVNDELGLDYDCTLKGWSPFIILNARFYKGIDNTLYLILCERGVRVMYDSQIGKCVIVVHR